MKNIISIMLIMASVGGFFGYINPQYMEIKELQAKKVLRDDALTKSRELQALRDDLLKRLNAFPSKDLSRLEKLLPNNIDNVRLIIDISSIAAKRGIVMKNINNPSAESVSAENKASLGGAQNPYGSATLNFTVSTTYDNFIAFLKDLEKSLRLVDVTSLSFSATETGSVYDFTVGIKTYWLK